MKTLRYLLIVTMISMASVLSVAYATAQNLAQQPQMEMQSTSVMQGSGSALPQAAVTGSYTTYDTYSPAGSVPNSPRRAKRGLDDGDDDIDPQGQPFPLGDAMIPLAVLALAYALARAFLKKKARA